MLPVAEPDFQGGGGGGQAGGNDLTLKGEGGKMVTSHTI